MPTPQTPAEMEAILLDKLPERYGKSLSEWMKICESAGLEKKMEYVHYLKQQYGIKHGEAFVLTQIYFNEGKPVYGDPGALLKEQYKTQKDRILYDFVVEKIVESLNEPIKIGICKGYTSLLGQKQFAVLLPKKKELWIGLALPQEEVNDLLKTTKNLGGSDKINRYIPISKKEDWGRRISEYVLKSYKYNI
jgi:hypothetical protein